MKRLINSLARKLEYKILALILLILVISFSVTYFILSAKIRQNMIREEIEESKLVADTIHETLDRDMMAFRADVVRFLMDDFKKLEGIKRIQIIRGDAPYVGNGRAQDEAFMDFKTLNDVRKRLTMLYRPEWEREHHDKTENIAAGSENPIFKEYFNQVIQSLEDKELLRNREQDLKRGVLDASYFEEIDGVPALTYLRPLPNFPKCALCHGMDHKIRGVLMISTSLESMDAALNQSRRFLLMASLGTIAVLILFLRVAMKRVVLTPVNNVVGRIKDIAEGEGDLTQRVAVNYQDEIGDVARWFNIFIGKLHHVISEVSRTARKVKEVSQQVLFGTKQIMEGSNVQINAVESTSNAAETLNKSVKHVAQNAETLSAMAEDSTVAILAMSSSIDEIARSASVLASSVEETTASILQMSSSIKQVAENVSNLNASAESTTGSMNEMDASIRQIRSNVHDTVALSKGVTDDAERGHKATGKTIEGISKIRDYSQQVNDVIRNLRVRTENIGKILNVIDEVAEQTNLLALNAAIIAAQSGEHGKSFAVVAQEIKELADQTATSTKEIHEIIRALQEESKNAVQAINRGTHSVEEGVRLSEEAGSALQKILESSKQSTDRIRQIAQATDDQTKSVKLVVEAMKQVTEMVQQIAQATREQSKGAEQIILATERVKEIATRVKSATHQQSTGNKQINEIVEQVSRRVKEIAAATGKQAEEGANILKEMNRVKSVVEQNVDAVGKVGVAVEEMIKQATKLSTEIDKFKL